MPKPPSPRLLLLSELGPPRPQLARIPKIHKTLEPRAPAPRKRLAAIRALNEAAVPAFVSIAPVIPQITDHELDLILHRGVHCEGQQAFRPGLHGFNGSDPLVLSASLKSPRRIFSVGTV